jgi:DNA-binding transcriptional LysR family regulator
MNAETDGIHRKANDTGGAWGCTLRTAGATIAASTAMSGSAVLDLHELEAFLAVAEERHFGHAAARLRRSESRVSRLVAALERRVGGRLFERTSRRVTPTSLGERLYESLAPAHAQLVAAVDDTRRAAAGLNGQLRIGYHSVSAVSDAFVGLARAFETRYPECALRYIEIEVKEPYAALRRGEIDLLVTYRPLDHEPDIVIGQCVDSQPRVLVVASDHPLAGREHISIEEIPDWPCVVMPSDVILPALYDGVVPPATPAGRPLNRSVVAQSIQDIAHHVEQGRAVHLAVPNFRNFTVDKHTAFIPVPDMPPLDRVLVWRAGNDSPQLRRFTALANGSGDLLRTWQ